MSHFNVKTLSFYGVAISSVLALFKIVSAYGETNLTAAPKIGGTYQIVESQNLPACLADKKLNLTIEQSGVYLSGNLSEASDKSTETLENAKAEFALSGDFKNPEIMMSGQGNLANCEPGLPLTVQGRIEKTGLIGTLEESGSSSNGGTFTAQYQEVKAESSEGH
jgi:hypothetical protein